MRSKFLQVIVCITTLQVTGGVHGQPAKVGKTNCAQVEDLAKRAYGRIRDARMLKNETRAIENSAGFWDIAEKGRECARIRMMAVELEKVGLSLEATVVSRRDVEPENQDGNGEGQSQRGSQISGGSGGSGASGSGPWGGFSFPVPRPPEDLN